jgi:hypothetical protein
MESPMMFLDCPACLDEEGTARCGLPAEVRCRFTIRSSDGPLEAAMIRCPSGHWFNGPIESLTRDSRNKHDPAHPGTASGARPDSLKGSHDGRDGRGGSVSQDFPEQPEQEIHRPNGAPAYYLARPACLYITAMIPRRRRNAWQGAVGCRPPAAATGNTTAILGREEGPHRPELVHDPAAPRSRGGRSPGWR